jgi:medium-chain acyl-[acyl-carrier-protein] hydrolase
MNKTSVDNWFAYRRPARQARLRLFCFPYAGGSAALYRSWPDLLPGQVDIWPIQLPGHGGRLLETPVADRSQLLEALRTVLSSHLDLPYAFFVHSLGAGLAFELACAFRQRNAPLPVHLFVSGCRAPQLPLRQPPRATLADAELIEELRQLKGTPEEILRNEELLRLSLPMLRADFAVFEAQAPYTQEPLPCPVSAYGGLRDPEVFREDLLAWRQATTGAFKCQFFPGDHFFIHSSQTNLLQVLSHELRAYL